SSLVFHLPCLPSRIDCVWQTRTFAVPIRSLPSPSACRSSGPGQEPRSLGQFVAQRIAWHNGGARVPFSPDNAIRCQRVVMRARPALLAPLVLPALLAFNAFPGGRRPAATPVAALGGEEKDRDADREAIRAGAKEFVKLFEKADAKGLAGLWTAAGEYHDERG